MPRKPTYLYNCKHDGDQYRITKFTEDLNVESSYLCTEAECECPAGHRSTCRHRQMLPKFRARKATNGSWFFDYDRESWLRSDPTEVDHDDDHETTLTVLDPPLHEPTVQGPHAFELPTLPPGIRMLDLADISSVHNTIADALGEIPDYGKELPSPNPIYLTPSMYAQARAQGLDMTPYAVITPILATDEGTMDPACDSRVCPPSPKPEIDRKALRRI